MIPREIHFIWIGPEMPDWARDNINRFIDLNPGFAVSVHGEEVLLKSLRPAYDRIKGEHLYARRSDLLRISVLLKTGGWYFDTDFVPFRPLNNIYTRYIDFPKGAFVTHCDYLNGRPWMANGIIGTQKDSPFLAKLLEGVIRTAEWKRELGWGDYGPCIVTELVERFPDMMHVGDLKDYYRILDHKKTREAYKHIVSCGFSENSITNTLGKPVPYMLHIGMEDSLEI